MKSIRALIVVLVSIFLLSEVTFAERISKAILDLSSHNLKNISEQIKIDGDVEFYWQELFAPADFADSTITFEPAYVRIPKSWTSYDIMGNKLGSNGFGTYRFWIKLSDSNSSEVLGFRVPSIFSSYKLWVNGNLIAHAGTIGKSPEDHRPGFHIGDIPFSINGKDKVPDIVEVVIQVSNYSHRRAGLPWPIFFGRFEALQKASRSMDILNLVVLGIILIIGLNHINMYFFRRKDVSNFYFGLLTLVMILRNISTGDRILGYLFPDISWDLMLKLDNFSGYGTIPFFAMFFYSQYQNEFRKGVRNFLVLLGMIISLVIFVLPVATFGKVNIAFELYLLVGGLYLTFGILLPAAIHKRDGALLSFIGMFLLYATAINDVLSSMEILHTPYVAPYGLVSFMLLQSFTITSKSARAINENEELSHQLEKEKEGLERNIEERTRELVKQHDALIEHQEKEKIQGWITKGLAKVNSVLSANKNDFDELSRKLLTTLVKYMGVKLGALYVVSDSDYDSALQMVASYGGSKEMLVNNRRVDFGDGLIGAAFADNQLKTLTDVPKGFYKVNSGLGASYPKSVLIAPLSTDDAVFGVIELARFDEFRPEEIEFVKKIAHSIASSLSAVRMNDRNINLIQQFQEQSEQIAEKEERLRESLSELEYLREQYTKLRNENDRLKEN